MVVRFVCVIRVPVCALLSLGVSRPVPRGVSFYRYRASTQYYRYFDLVSLAGITGTMEPRGIFSMAVPAEVLAAALAEDGSRRSRPGAVPDYCTASRSTGVACCTT